MGAFGRNTTRFQLWEKGSIAGVVTTGGTSSADPN